MQKSTTPRRVGPREWAENYGFISAPGSDYTIPADSLLSLSADIDAAANGNTRVGPRRAVAQLAQGGLQAWLDELSRVLSETPQGTRPESVTTDVNTLRTWIADWLGADGGDNDE